MLITNSIQQMRANYSRYHMGTRHTTAVITTAQAYFRITETIKAIILSSGEALLPTDLKHR